MIRFDYLFCFRLIRIYGFISRRISQFWKFEGRRSGAREFRKMVLQDDFRNYRHSSWLLNELERNLRSQWFVLDLRFAFAKFRAKLAFRAKFSSFIGSKRWRSCALYSLATAITLIKMDLKKFDYSIGSFLRWKWQRNQPEGSRNLVILSRLCILRRASASMCLQDTHNHMLFAGKLQLLCSHNGNLPTKFKPLLQRLCWISKRFCSILMVEKKRFEKVDIL